MLLHYILIQQEIKIDFPEIPKFNLAYLLTDCHYNYIDTLCFLADDIIIEANKKYHFLTTLSFNNRKCKAVCIRIYFVH